RPMTPPIKRRSARTRGRADGARATVTGKWKTRPPVAGSAPVGDAVGSSAFWASVMYVDSACLALAGNVDFPLRAAPRGRVLDRPAHRAPIGPGGPFCAPFWP